MGLSLDGFRSMPPNQNGLVERFNRVISEKLKECERFGWNIEKTLEKMLIDYRSTPHSTTGISPFEALYGRKMRDGLTRLHPELQEVPVRSIDREKVSRRQDYMKAQVDSKRKPNEWDIQIGDRVRVQGPDGWYRDYEEVSEVGKASVTLKNGDTWPVSSISSKTSRAIASKRNTVQKSSEPEKGEEAGKIYPGVKNGASPQAEGSESSKTSENRPQSYEEFKRRKVADTTVVESREQENRPQSYEEFKRRKVADTTVVESREQENRPQSYEEFKEKNVADTTVDRRVGRPQENEEPTEMVKESHEYYRNSVWRRSRDQ